MALISSIEFKVKVLQNAENIFKILKNGTQHVGLKYVCKDGRYMESTEEVLTEILTELKDDKKKSASIYIKYLDIYATLLFYKSMSDFFEFSIIMPQIPKYSLLYGSSGAVNLPLNYEQHIRVGLLLCHNIPIKEIHTSIF